MNPVFFRRGASILMANAMGITEKNFGERFLLAKNLYMLNISMLKKQSEIELFLNLMLGKFHE